MTDNNVTQTDVKALQKLIKKNANDFALAMGAMRRENEQIRAELTQAEKAIEENNSTIGRLDDLLQCATAREEELRAKLQRIREMIFEDPSQPIKNAKQVLGEWEER